MAASVPFTLISQPFDATPSQLAKPALHEPSPQVPLLQVAAAFVNEHVLQAPPPVPQVLADGASHVFPLQQPVHPDEVLQMHDPLLQVCPLPHPGEQDAPPMPQLVLDWLASATQVFPLQQPAQPDEVLQMHDPLLQACPLAHPGEQDAPPVPQLVLDWLEYGTQVFPLQQPFGQDVPSQTHFPALLHV